MTPSVQQRTTRPITVIIIVAIAAALAAGMVWFLNQPVDQSSNVPELTPEARAYTKYLKLSEVEMKATDNTLGQTLVEILGRITNNGDRPVKHVLLTCVFYDPYGQVLAREVVAIVRTKDGILYPSESRRFRLPFDALPDGWNQTMPQLVIAEIDFGDKQ